MAKTKKTKTPLNSDLKLRVLEAKKRLPNSGVSSLFLHLHPEYDTDSERTRLNNVLQLRVTDEEMTKKLESIADLLEIDEETQAKYKWLAEQK